MRLSFFSWSGSRAKPSSLFMRQGDAGDVENTRGVAKPGVLHRARERICSPQGRICVFFAMVALGLFVVWPLTLALTAAAQGPLPAPNRDGIPPALAPDPRLPLPDDSLPLPDGRYVAIVPYPAPAATVVPSEDDDAGAPPLDCDTVRGVSGGMTGVDLFYNLTFLSGLERLVVPGGAFHEVVGDLTVFAPVDDALISELDFFADVLNVTRDDVTRDAPLLQEILRQFIAYGDVGESYRGLFVTLDGSLWNYTRGDVDGGEIALVPVGIQLEEPPVILKVDDDAGVLAGCSRGRRLSGVVRATRYARWARRQIRRKGTVWG